MVSPTEPPGWSRRGRGGSNWTEVQERSLCGSEAARPHLFGETEAVSHLPRPSVWPWLLPLWRRRETDVRYKFDEACFSLVTTCDSFPSGREAARGALIVVSGDPGSSSCSVTNAQGDLGQVTFGLQSSHGQSEDVNLQVFGILRFFGFVSEISRSIINSIVKWNTLICY